MKRFVLYAGIAILATLGITVVIACGGGDGEADSDRVLILNSGSFTEEEYRVRLRARFISFSELFEPLCDEAQKSSFNELLDLINELDDSPPEQEAVRRDQERAFEILREECDRRF